MRLTSSEFDHQLMENKLRIAVSGMSGSGKSKIKKKLEEQNGFRTNSVDEKIGQSLGFSTMEQLANWMGFPYEDGYEEKSSEYLDREEHLTWEAIDAAASDDVGNFLLDLTGSAIYLSPALQNKLREKFLVIGLAATPKLLIKLETNFAQSPQSPKPIVWNGCYEQLEGESQVEALKRSFRKLLEDRMAKYKILPHIFVPAEIAKKNAISTETFFDFVRLALENAELKDRLLKLTLS